MRIIRKNLKYIFPFLIAIMVLGLVLSRVFQPDDSNIDTKTPEPEIRINATLASEYVGRSAEVCGEVSSASYVPRIDGKPTFLNFGHPHPDQYFSAVIWNNNRGKWNQPPERQYRDERICVTGVIEMHEGTPQIIVYDPSQISN